ncbi:hypothetical protein [Limisphaera sp. VF-2]|jgi:hypothetical protein|uniref:hypothetical protein n=1 Tax=Limisphaera sp. VF-2 TaxID=3400418 RepID=UPI0017778693
MNAPRPEWLNRVRQWPAEWQGWWETRRGTPRRLLGLSLEAGQLEGAVVERVHDRLEIRQTVQASLALDPLTAEPELVGRELRQHLEAAGVRTRICVVDLPLEHVLTMGMPLPEVPPEDQDSFLLLEAERTLPLPLEELQVATTRGSLPSGGVFGMVLAVSREYVARWEATLQAAQLRPLSLSPGLCALAALEPGDAPGVIALWPAGERLHVQVSVGNALVALRTIEGAFVQEGAARQFAQEDVMRELRITIGQLPTEIQEQLQKVRVWGRSEAAQEVAEALVEPLAGMGLRVEQTRSLPEELWGCRIPAGLAPSVVVALAGRALAGRAPLAEFLPPRVSVWQQLRSRYASRRLATAGLVAGCVNGLVAGAFLVQQIQLWYWEHQWRRIQQPVAELEWVQARIREYRPWFDDSFRSLTVLKRLTEAFPEDGTVSARTVELRDNGRVLCTGTARDQAALLRTLDRLRAFPEVGQVQVEQMRGNAPIQFTFNLQWRERAGS